MFTNDIFFFETHNSGSYIYHHCSRQHKIMSFLYAYFHLEWRSLTKFLVKIKPFLYIYLKTCGTVDSPNQHYVQLLWENGSDGTVVETRKSKCNPYVCVPKCQYSRLFSPWDCCLDKAGSKVRLGSVSQRTQF